MFKSSDHINEKGDGTYHAHATQFFCCINRKWNLKKMMFYFFFFFFLLKTLIVGTIDKTILASTFNLCFVSKF